MGTRVVIGSRGSRLALWQAEWARKALLRYRPDLRIDIEVIRTRGDRMLNAPFPEIGGKGVFTREIEEALLDGRVDLAVHSLKDLPTELPHGLEIGAVSPRTDVRDALLSQNGEGLDGLRQGARVGTGSLRRQAQLRHLRPDLALEGIRGNVDTRLKKLALEGLDAVVLAAAGLERLGWRDRVSEFLPPDRVLPAPGQGAMAVEVRCGDRRVMGLVARVEDGTARRMVTAERTMLRVLGGGAGCRSAPGHGWRGDVWWPRAWWPCPMGAGWCGGAPPERLTGQRRSGRGLRMRCWRREQGRFWRGSAHRIWPSLFKLLWCLSREPRTHFNCESIWPKGRST